MASINMLPTRRVHDKSGPNARTNGVTFNDPETESVMSQDTIDMRRLGIEQRTERRFGLVTMLGFTSTLMCTWESALAFFVTAFINGGGVSMVYGYMLAFAGSLATCASLAEMASIYPVSGGQYHWVALLAPPRYSKFLSWLTGWLCMLGWQAATSNGTYLAGTLIQSLISFNHPEYEIKGWQTTLFLYAVLLFSLAANTVLVKFLPGFEGMILILQIVGIFAIMIPLVYLGPISSNEFVWTQFTNLSGYKDAGLSWIIGQAATAILFVGNDGACHMAEEVRNAAINVPRAMILALSINGALGFATYIFILYCMGDPDLVLKNQYGTPFLQIFYNATLSKAGTTLMASLLVVMFTSGTLAFLASSSRQLWAFSRDDGLPYSSIFKRIDRKSSIPLWAIGFTGVFSALIGLIGIGSVVAFNATISLTVAGFLSSYLIAILAMISKRLRKEPIKFGPWNLGRYGMAINVFAAIYTFVTTIFTFFPPSLPVAAETMNWSCAVFGSVVIVGVVYYAIAGHRSYKGPRLEESLDSVCL